MKTCCGCLVEKSHEDFYTREGGKPTSRCKQCMTDAANQWRAQHKDRAAANQRALRNRRKRDDPQWWRDNHYRATYGITLAEYEALHEKQNGRCAICDQRSSGSGRWQRLVVDHRHMDGVIRGLLCRRCNSALGMLHDDPNLALQAALYLEGT